MTCAKLTRQEFIAAKPQFASVDGGLLDSYIDLAQVWTSGLPDSLCAVGQIAVTCHLLTLDGLGTGAEAKGFATGQADVQTISSASVTVTRFRAASEGAGQTTAGWFGQTACGRMFMALIRGVVGGPRVAGASGRAVSPYAKDAWW